MRMTIDKIIIHRKEESSRLMREYESPVNVIQSQIQIETEGEIMKAVQKLGVIVDKEELIKALRYDRGQYDKGFENGYNKAIDDFVKSCDKHCGFYTGDNKILTREDILRIAEQLKAGGIK